MIYSDLIFVFAFLPIYLTASFCCREAWAKNAVSVLAAIVFIMWGRQWYLSLIILPVILIYILGFLPKRLQKIFSILFGAAAAGFSVFAAVYIGSDGSLASSLLSVGMCLFALRCVDYESEIAHGLEPERDFFALAAWLLSLENVLICPLETYESSRKRLHSRKVTLSKMSLGAVMFIKGFAKTAVCGLACERLRLAAISGSAFPWMNALFSVGAAVLGGYITVSGVLEMSCGMGAMNGFSPKAEISGFVPRFRISSHIEGLWGGLPGFIKGCFCRTGRSSAISLVCISLLTGVLFSFGAGAAAAFGIIVIAIIIEGNSSENEKPSDLILSVAVGLAAALLLGCRSPQGTVGFFVALDYNKYGYDITYALNAEFWRSLPWVAIGLIVLSPLPSLFGGAIRRKMRESDSFYAAARVAETVLCIVLLVIGTVAAGV